MKQVRMMQRECEICQQVKLCIPVPVKAVVGRDRREEWLCDECTNLLIEEQVVEQYDEDDTYTCQ
jgi:hypothetical protein